ncbi:MAG: hypothetical protein HY924_06365 [Elusimicrobia bacterium]|nr:hypothetical protein [Elusimicrobiota bacterium]
MSPQDHGPDAPSDRDLGTRRLALLCVAALVIVPLLWFLGVFLLDRWAPERRAKAGEVFDKKPGAAASQAPAPLPPPAQAAVSPAPIPLAPPPPPAAPPTAPPAVPTLPGSEEPGTVLKVVEVQYPSRGESRSEERGPKLKPMKGWTPTQVRSLQDSDVPRTAEGPVYYLTPEPKAKEPQKPAPPAVSPAEAPKPEPQPAPKEEPKPVLAPVPTRRVETPVEKPKPPAPPPPVMTTTVGPGGPIGTMDHVPRPPDAWLKPPPADASEPARPDGTCRRASWWKNSWTQTCHPSAQACAAADPSGACSQ